MSIEPSDEATAVQAAVDEAEPSSTRTITFGDGDDAVTFDLPRKWKRFRFMRAIARGDIATCLDSIWPPTKERDEVTGDMVDTPHPTVEQIEDIEVDDEAFADAFERLARAVGGTSAGNSKSSPA